MLRNCPALVLGATLLSLGACSTTTFTSTWKAPDGQTINPAGKTIAAVFVSGDERNRHAAEDALAKDLNARGAHGVPGYTLLPNEIRGDAEDMLARLKEAGANEVVVMRVVGVDKWPSYLQVHGWTFSASDTPGTGNLPSVTGLQHFDTVVSVLVCSLDLGPQSARAGLPDLPRAGIGRDVWVGLEDVWCGLAHPSAFLFDSFDLGP